MKAEKEYFALHTIFKRLINDLEPHARAKRLDIIWPQSDFTVFSDPTLLEQILRNYVSNAIRYTQVGEIRVECEAIDNQILITVSDTGIGIPSSEQERIFDEFHQLNNPERDRSKGLGLGLSIVKRTADLLNHRIGVQSEYGKGSVFSISVDRGSHHETENDKHAFISNEMHSGTPPLFVVIDDESSVRDGMFSRLQLWGCEVITATDQEEALDRLQQIRRRPNGIIADFRLRENRNGVDAIRAIQAVYGNHIPALIVTGDIAVEQLRDANNSGFQVLHKPVAPLKLRTFLRHVQRQSALHAPDI